METQDSNSRFFAFGCSYTNYLWPTYADYLAATFDESYNYAKCGGGNQFIFNTFVHAITKHDIKEGDTVIIQWSSLCRFDRIVESAGSYSVHGLMSSQEEIPDEIIKGHSPLQSALELVSYIKSAIALSEQKKINLKMIHMFEPWIGTFLGEPVDHNFGISNFDPIVKETNLFFQLKNFYNSPYFLDKSIEMRRIEDKRKWPSVYCSYPNRDGSLPEPNLDNHPHPLEHYEISLQIGIEWNIDTTEIKVPLIINYVEQIENWFTNLPNLLHEPYMYLSSDDCKPAEIHFEHHPMCTKHITAIKPAKLLNKEHYFDNSYIEKFHLDSPWTKHDVEEFNIKTLLLKKFNNFVLDRFRIKSTRTLL